MSLVPYSPRESRSVVLRHQQTLVVYDPQSQQLALRDATPAPSSDIQEFGQCPLCKQPLRSNEPPVDHAGPSLPAGNHHAGSPMAESGFVDQDYFRLLDASNVSPHRTARSGGPMGGNPQSPTRRWLPKPRSEMQGQQDMEPEVMSDSSPTLSTNKHGISSKAFSPDYFERFFVTEAELGRGGKGVVLLVRHVLDGVSLGHFACKRVPVGDNHKWLERVLMEVQLLQQLSHSNLVSYRHVWLEDVHLTTFGPSVPCAFILQQYCNAGDLHNYVLQAAKQTTKEQLKERMRRRSRGQADLGQDANKPRRMPFEQIISFFRDIASGLAHLHSNGFIHRDLKPSNCLLNDSGIPGQELKVLVSDFGEVQMENAARKSTGATGTISYCAPEVLRRVHPDGEFGNFTQKSDIFSLGMILHFMCFGKLPYLGSDELNEENENLDSLREEILAWGGLDERAKLRPDLPDRLYQSLKTLISPDPMVRPSAEEILVGIEMGIGDEPTTFRRTSTVSQKKPIPVSEDSQTIGFRRISPVADTPPPAPVTTPSMQLKKDRASSRENLIHRASLVPKMQKPSSTLASMSMKMDKNHEAKVGDVGSSLVLRSAVNGANGTTSPALVKVMGWRQNAEFFISRRPELLTFIKLAVFFLKVVSLTRPCSPVAANPCAFYPLICLGALDFASPFLMPMVVLGLLHAVLLVLVNMMGSLCLY
ncbi:putative serine/threonine-protein kinase iks1 [Rhizina undulata]